MSDRHLDNLLPDFGEYTLDSFLDDYRKSVAAAAENETSQPLRPAESIARRSRQIVADALGDTLAQFQQSALREWDASQREEKAEASQKAAAPFASQDTAEDAAETVDEDVGTHEQEDTPAPEDKPAPEVEPVPETETASDTTPAPETETEAIHKLEAALKAGADRKAEPAEQQAPPKKRIHVSDDGIITLDIGEPSVQANVTAQPIREENTREAAPEREQPSPERRRPRPRREASAMDRSAQAENRRERLLWPLIQMAATKFVRKQMQKTEAANWPDPVEIRETPELPPRKAGRFYATQLRPLRFRFRTCFFLCVVLAWISLGLPMAGMLGQDVSVQAGVCLLLLMTVMLTALDVVAAGFRQLLELHPGAEALAALAALFSCVDAVLVMGEWSDALPFCAVGAVSLTCALWGERLTCLAMARTMRTAAFSKDPAVLSAADDLPGGEALLRAHRTVEGIVRRSEQTDFCQDIYATAAPALLCASLLLALLASLNGKSNQFLHTFSALLCVSASFTAFLSFPLPFSLTARKLQSSGAAIAGYAGCADIGKTRRVVITDEDLFPPGTIKLSGINILEGAFVDKVISYTTSLLAASGSGVTAIFMELVTRRGYSMVQVDEFKYHEGGGLSANIGGERILVGSARYMNLMGIRLPQNLNAKNAVCTAISDELVGVFTVDYIPTSSVQEALVTLLQGRAQAVFAIRDFNITPLMIRQLFRMPTDNFHFPSFRERCQISATTVADTAPVAAVVARSGMGPVVDAAETGRKLYSICRIGTIISLVGSALGMLILFLLFRAGSYDTATAGNVLSYMLLWALPVGILAMGQNR